MIPDRQHHGYIARRRIRRNHGVDLQNSSAEEGAALQKKLEALLWEDADVRDLYRQVLINKGLVERIIVRQDGKVVEGNCRTVVYSAGRER